MGVAAKGVDAWCVFISLAVLLFCNKAKSDTMDAQGSIFCLSDHGNKATPILGATARIKCKSSDGGNMRFISSPTNKNGFYTVTTSSSTSKLRKCKAFLESSPLAGCSSPTNINGGRSGSDLIPFSSSKHSPNKQYSVKPLFYSSNS